jgi:hypothetical protein
MKTLKKALALVLALALCLSLATVAFAANYDSYADASEVTDDYAEAVDVVVGLGVITGKDGNKLDLSGTLTRAEAAKILAVLDLGTTLAASVNSSTASTGFSDTQGNWASGYIAYNVSKGYLAGSNGKFDPDGELTGTAFGKMLLNAYGMGLSNKIVDGTETVVNRYEGSSWAINVIVDGNSINLFDGVKSDVNGTITRAEAMQMVFNLLKENSNNWTLEQNPYSMLPTEFAIKTKAADNDAYGRTGYKWVAGSSEKVVSGDYMSAADYVYVADQGDTTIGDILAAYNKANNLKGDKKYAENDKTEVTSGTVVEFTFNKVAHTYTTLTYSYRLDTVKSVGTKAVAANAEEHAGAYAITLEGGDTIYTDDLKITVAKNDVIIIPVNSDDEDVLADATIATPVRATATSVDKDGNYVVVNGAKLYKDDAVAASGVTVGTGKTIAFSSIGFKDTYNFYKTPANTVAAVSVYEEAAAAYTTTVAYLLDSQAKSTVGEDADLFGEDGTTAAAKAILQIVDATGTVKLLNVAIAKNADDEFVYTGTDAIGLGTTGKNPVVKASAKGAVKDKFVEYYTDSNGDAVIVAIHDTTAVSSYAKASVAIAGSNANSKTVMNIVRYTTTEKGTTYAGTTYTGYKNFPAITSGVAYFDTTANVVTVYAAAEQVNTETTASIAYCKSAGDLTASGYAYTFVVDGKEVTYYNAANDAAVAGKFYKNLVVDTDKGTFTTKDAEVVTKLTVVSVDENYFVHTASTVVEYAANTQIVDLTDNGITALEEGLTVVVFNTKTVDEVVTDMVIFVVPADAE